jgi:hypothetical protein
MDIKLAVKYVTIEAALVNDIVPDPLQPSMHAHDLSFMRFRASVWCKALVDHV